MLINAVLFLKMQNPLSLSVLGGFAYRTKIIFYTPGSVTHSGAIGQSQSLQLII